MYYCLRFHDLINHFQVGVQTLILDCHIIFFDRLLTLQQVCNCNDYYFQETEIMDPVDIKPEVEDVLETNVTVTLVSAFHSVS